MDISFVENSIQKNLQVVRDILARYGFDIEYRPKYKYIEPDTFGTYFPVGQKKANIFPIALNPELFLRQYSGDEEKLDREVLVTILHEAGHGIVNFIRRTIDVNFLEDDHKEENAVEEFAWYHCGMCEASYLNDYCFQNIDSRNER